MAHADPVAAIAPAPTGRRERKKAATDAALREAAQQLVARRRVGGLRRLVEQGTEAVRVNRAGWRLEGVAAPVGHQDHAVGTRARLGEQSPQAGDIGTDRLQGAVGRVVVPEELSESAGGDGTAGFEQQDCEQGAFVPAGRGQRPAVIGRYLDRSEHAELHGGHCSQTV